MPLADQLNQAMLTHAAVIYRGFARPAGGGAGLRSAMTETLEQLSPVKGQWDIVWGPATFRADLDPFADSAMYVARHRAPSGRSRCVVVIRGTNPISLVDWMFGDFMVFRQVPWAYGRPEDRQDAKLSFSTALGLRILQNMRSEPPADPRWPPLAAGSISRAEALDETTSRPAQALTAGVRRALERGRNALIGAPWNLDEIKQHVTRDKLADWATALGRRLRSKGWAEGLKAIDAAAGGRLDPLRLIPGAATALQSLSKGVTVQEFLRGQTAMAHGDLDVYVTGHSKGGALAQAFAAWLADTQGTASGTTAEQWDPDRAATVHAYAFAGPTPGNGAFARHVDTILGDRCHRIFNRLDLVPHAFAAHDLNLIPGLYGAPESERKILEALVAKLVRAVEPLDYQHTSSDSIELLGRLVDGASFAFQAIHQHLDGYFEQLGLSQEMGMQTFFGRL